MPINFNSVIDGGRNCHAGVGVAFSYRMPKYTWMHGATRRFFSAEHVHWRLGMAAASGGLISILYFRQKEGLLFAQTANAEATLSSASASKSNQSFRLCIPIFDTNRSLKKPGDAPEDRRDLYHLRLQNVQVFFRHGARTPLHTLETLLKEEQALWHSSMLGEPIRTMIKYDLRTLDGQSPISLADSPYDRDLYSQIVFPGGCIAGQMTVLGKMQTFHLGQQLRSQYINQLGLTKRTFSNTEVYVRSTYIKRTIESARCLIAGMFDQQAAGGEIPVIHIATTEDEIMYPNAGLCQAYKNATLELFTRADEIPGLKDAREAVEKLLGWSNAPTADGKPRKPLNFSDLRDVLVSQREHGLPIPQRLEAWYDRVEKFGTDMILRYVIGLNILNPDSVRRVLRVSCGPAVHMIQKNIGHALDTEPYYKLMLYSTHDSTLVALLCALGIFDNRWPPFAADLCIETYVDEATHDAWIRVLYLGNPVKLPGADGDFCSLRDFHKLLAPFTVKLEIYLRECDDQTVSPR